MAENVAVSTGSRIGESAMDGPLVGAARRVESAARRVKENVAEKSIGEIVNDGREYIRENPGKTILISMGVGALIGYVIGRRRS